MLSRVGGVHGHGKGERRRNYNTMLLRRKVVLPPPILPAIAVCDAILSKQTDSLVLSLVILNGCADIRKKLQRKYTIIAYAQVTVRKEDGAARR